MKDISNLSREEFAQVFIDLHTLIVKDPIKNFIEAQGFCNTILTPGQRVLFKLVMNYKLDNQIKFHCNIEDLEAEEFTLNDLEMTEVELYKYLTDKDYDESNSQQIRDITMILGRRAGKTMCASLLAIYNSLKINWQPMLGRKKIATILVISHTTEFSNETIGEIKAIIKESPILSKLINPKAKNTQSTINLSIPFKDNKGKIIYSHVRIRSNAASSKSSRGSACPVIITDELAFFGSDPNSKETDKEIMRAIRPSMLQFEDSAMLIALSTPNVRSGYLFEKYDQRDTLSEEHVVLKAPSWVFNNRYRAEDFFDFWKEDPDNFTREFRANFVDSLSSFLNPTSIDQAVLKGVSIIPPELKNSAVKYFCAIDSAFKDDVFTVNILGLHENRIKQYATLGFKGTRSNPVQSSDVAASIRELNKQYDFGVVYADQFSFNPLKEIFSQYNLTLEERTFTNIFKQKIYKNLKYLIESQQIDLLDHKQTIKELKEIQVELSNTGRIKILHPLGGHDDYADSLAIAAYIAKEQAGEIGISFESTLSNKDYGIVRDVNGICFSAPSPDILSEKYEYEIDDNSSGFDIDIKTGKLVRFEDLDENDDDSDCSFSF